MGNTKKLAACLAVFLLSLLVVCAQADMVVGDMITFGSWHQGSDARDSTPIQ